MTPKGATFFTCSVEPFLQSYLSHANSPSAFPTPAARQQGKAPNPILVYFAWTNPLHDDEFIAAIQESVDRLTAIAKPEGLLIDKPTVFYGNYATAKTPLVDVYGENLPRLRALKTKIDPRSVMDLAGGLKIPHALDRVEL